MGGSGSVSGEAVDLDAEFAACGQQQKQQEVDTMKAQCEEQQKALEEMQEAARKEGFGSSVYDP